MPGSEPTGLSRLFGTRDSGQILDGMSKLLEVEADRITEGRQRETDNPDKGLDPEVTKMLDKAFSHAEKFAKLIDPALRTPGAQVNNNTLNVVAGMTPQQIAAQAVDYLVQQGIPRSEVTDELVFKVMGAAAESGRSIEATAIEVATVVRANP